VHNRSSVLLVDATAEHHRLVSELRHFILPWRRLTIGIDGRDDSGKSSLGRFLSWQLGIPVIETDLFILPNCDGPAYRTAELQTLITTRHRRSREGSPLIVEGVFVADLLNSIGVACDALITVQREKSDGALIWAERFADYEARQKRIDYSQRYYFHWNGTAGGKDEPKRSS
jgi:hypothetical protein